MGNGDNDACSGHGWAGKRPSRRGRIRGKEPIPPAARRAAVAGFVGTFIEYYDYSIFALLAVYVAPLFFPADNPAISQLAGLAVYGVGFVARPLGGIVFGRIGDRRGRRIALMMTVGLVGGCSAAIGMLPTYAVVGVIAPILLILLRLGQGLSAGSEMLGSITYVIESAPPSRRALLASLTPLGGGLGSGTGALACLLVGLVFSKDDMASFGWRIPFIAAVPLTLIAFLLRKRIEDSPEFIKLAQSKQIAKSPLREALTRHWRSMLVACGLSAAGYGATGVSAFFVSYLVSTRGLPFSSVMGAFAAALLLGPLVIPAAGALTDRFGQRRLLGLVFVAFILMSVPILFVLGWADSILLLGIAMTAFMGLVGFINAPLWSYIATLFPAPVRFTASTFGANVGAVTTGSTGGLAAGALFFATGSPLAPAIWIVGCCLLGLGVLAASKGLAQSSSMVPPATRRDIRGVVSLQQELE